MHVTRPKSAKGRTRTTPQTFTHNVEEYTCSISPPPPRPPTARVPTSPRIPQNDVPELLHQVAARPPSASLNRYRVLPSIGVTRSPGQAEAEDLPRQIGSMRLGSGARERHVKSLYREQVHSPELLKVPLNLQEPSDHEPRLLLAIRTHTGQRFERYFRPTDTLHVVLAVAEEKTGTSCKKCSVEAMEVPRRSFPDLHLTLQECGILNKSVLCIQRERD
uniref:UBX domain protein 10 n=1 Tax=Leptobrachium leishanense TaxID=445787 RepID=A0A8C5QAY4_9ANUR